MRVYGQRWVMGMLRCSRSCCFFGFLAIDIVAKVAVGLGASKG